MRVVFLNPVGQLGGAERSLLDLLVSLGTAMPELERHLIVASEGPLIERASALGVTVHHLPMPAAMAGLGDSGLQGRGKLHRLLGFVRSGTPASVATLRYARKLRNRLRDLKPDLVHSNGMKMHLLLWISGSGGAPVVWHLRDFPGSRPLMSRLLRWISSSCSHVIAISDAVGRDVRAVLPSVPVTVVLNAVDTDHFSPESDEDIDLNALASLAPPDGDCVRIGLVATYARWKGQELFLKALSRLDVSLPVRGYLIGGPIYQTQGSQFRVEELRETARLLGVGDRVGFVPFQSDPAAIYRALDIVVHASTQPEPFGRTIAEAMSCGRPTIVARAGGAAELFSEGVDALGFEPGNPDALAEAMRSLIVAPTLRNALGTAARATAVRRFSRDRLGVEVADVYRRLV